MQIAFPTPNTHNYQIFEDDESERACENVAHKHKIPHSNLWSTPEHLESYYEGKKRKVREKHERGKYFRGSSTE